MATAVPLETPSGNPAPFQTRAQRYPFIDLLRGFALVVMIETHVVNAYLPAGPRHSPVFFWLSFVNGLVAPTFLFAAGFSVMLLASRQWDRWLRFDVPFWRQMRRLGFILLVAYYSHLQGFRASKYLRPDDPAIWKESLQVDILQCIVASLLLVHLLIFLLRRPRSFLWGAVAVALGIVLATPYMWSIDFTSRLPLSLALYLNPHRVSLFPLFPWAGFVLAGACAGQLFLNSVRAGAVPLYMRRVLLAGAVAIPAALLGRAIPFTIPGHVQFYTTSPLYVALRIGCVLLICAGLFRIQGFQSRLLDAVRVAGQESLLVYGMHLWLIFAVMRGKHLGPILGRETGYLGCLAWSTLIIALLLWLARVWHNLKGRHPVGVRRAQALVVIAAIAVFLAR